jgi:protein-tyrosine phosphatase
MTTGRATVDPIPPVDTVLPMSPTSEAFTPDPTALDRSIAFELVFNVRDLGGLPVAGGGSTRRGVVYRGDGVHRLAGDDLERARTLGLRTVVDLRTTGEIERSQRFPVEEHPVDWHHLPLFERMWSEDDLVATTGAVDFLRERYLDMLVTGGGSIARVVELVAEGPPLLFHCAAGKDRTGVVSAVVLSLAGVPAEEIAGDYHATAGAMAAFVDWLTVAHPEALDTMTSQPPEYLEAPRDAMATFLDAVDDRYGSMEGYVAGLGVSTATVDALRAAVVDPGR